MIQLLTTSAIAGTTEKWRCRAFSELRHRGYAVGRSPPRVSPREGGNFRPRWTLLTAAPRSKVAWFTSQRIAGLETRVYLRGLLWNLASLSIRPSGPALPLARRSPSATAWG